MDPQLIQKLLAQLFQTQPQYDSKGNVKPFSLDEQAKALNYQQDQAFSLKDPILSAAATGGTGFDPSVFAPVQNGADTYDVPTDPLQAYLSLPDGSEERTIASGIASGQSPEQVVSSLGLTNDPEGLKRVRATANDLFKAKSQYQSQISTLPGYDTQSGQWSTPEGAQVAGGKLHIPKYVPSPASEAFQKAGLPDPTQLFGLQDFGYDQQGQAQKLGGAAQQLQGQTGAADAARQKFQMTANQSSVDKGTLDELQTYLLSKFGRDANLDTASSIVAQPATSIMGGRAGGMHTTPAMTQAQVAGTPGPAELAKLRASAAQGNASNYDLSTDRGKAYATYGTEITKQRKAERQLTKDSASDAFHQAYAKKRAALAQQDNITPLTMTLLQRAQALRGLG